MPKSRRKTKRMMFAVRTSLGAAIAASLLVALSPAHGGGDDDPRERFISAVETARTDYEVTVDRVEAAYDQRLTALEAASAALTQEARRRVVSGPLTDAREIREAALGAATVDQIRRMEEAVRDYRPAEDAYGAVKEAVTELRSELEVYRAVVDIADRTVDEAEASFDDATDVDARRASRSEALGEDTERARAVYEEAERAYEAAVANGSRRVEPRKTGGENLGRFLEGLNSLARGDEAAAERSASEIGRVRDAALADAEAANRAARGEHDREVSAAREARDTAYSAYWDVSGEASSARAIAAEARTTRESEQEEYEAAVAASRTVFVDLAKVTRVYQAVELREVERALLEGALSAVTQLEEETVSGITREAVRRVVESALLAYGEGRRTALEGLEILEAEFAVASDALSDSRSALEAARDENAALAVEAASAFDAAGRAYQLDLASADESFADALVRAGGGLKLMKRRRDIVRTASAEHRRAEQAAREALGLALGRALPGMTVSPPDYLAVSQYVHFVYVRDYFVDPPLPERLAEAFKSYKSARSSADERYRLQVVESWKKDTARLARQYGDAVTARDAALAALEREHDALREAVDPPPASASGAFSEQAVATRRALGARVRAGVLGLVP